jgi:hypothetical protein
MGFVIISLTSFIKFFSLSHLYLENIYVYKRSIGSGSYYYFLKNIIQMPNSTYRRKVTIRSIKSSGGTGVQKNEKKQRNI